jgi:osmotically-inducible protein OsmY
VPRVEKVHDRLRVRLLDAGRRNDADLRGAVLQALMLDSLVPSTIDARAKDGIVSLTGWAPYNYQRDAAMLVAGNVPGVIDLEDHVELSIGAPTPADVRHYVNKAFTRDARVDAEALSIDTDENTVTLSGHVRSWVEHDAAINAAWSAPGVVDVDDRARRRALIEGPREAAPAAQAFAHACASADAATRCRARGESR